MNNNQKPIAGNPSPLVQAATLLATDAAKAEVRARALLKAKPGDPAALLILASARRRQNDPADAHRILAPLAKAYPKAANTHYELGATLAALGKPAEAIAALRHATGLNPGLADAWRLLGEQLFGEGEIAAAEAAFAEHLVAAVQNPALKPAAKTLSQGLPGEAEKAVRPYLMAQPNDTEALRLMGETLLRLGRHSDAEILLAHCLALDSGQDGARFSYAEALFRQQKAVQAIPQAEHLLAQKPDDPAYLNLLAACFGLVGEDARVSEIYGHLSAAYPRQPRIWLNFGHALRTVGKSRDAMDAYRRCIALDPGLGDAYWSLANLKVAGFTAEEEATMLAQLERPDLIAEDRLHLHYALGKAMEDRGDYAASFEQYRQGAKLRRDGVTYDPGENTALTRRSIKVFTPAFFAERKGSGAASAGPIFVVGLPRSGSTLVEQILASHSAVEGTRELPDIGFLARDLGWMSGEAQNYPASVAMLDRAGLSALGQSFLDMTRIHRKTQRPFFIDKMPNNFQHIGLIHLILPGAKIIDVRRHPLGACFSAFKQHFAQGQSFSYDLSDLGLYYRDYVELMAHWGAVLPGRIHRVIYEDLVEDTEASVRRLLEHCGLPFEDACLNFHQNARAVRTVSSEQVRRPIFRDGVNQWRHYEPWLGPLKTALGPALENWRGEAISLS
jgi:tetratricopeptide (TPR) repeat protein